MGDYFDRLGEMTDEELEELAALPDDDLNHAVLGESWTQQDVRDFLEDLGDFQQDWQGIPVPVEGAPIVLQPKHPMADFYRELAPPVDSGLEEGERIVNWWWDGRRNRVVYIIDKDGRRFPIVAPVAPDRSMDRLGLWLQTLGASDGWNVDAEHRARRRLRSMLTERQWRHYDLTGTFIEESPRSNVTYVFRRLRPTIALVPRLRNGRDDDTMKCLAVLCLHPIGYYANTWAGCMVPSDDVMAHLTMMRADEARFWAKAVKHEPHEPEAGL